MKFISFKWERYGMCYGWSESIHEFIDWLIRERERFSFTFILFLFLCNFTGLNYISQYRIITFRRQRNFFLLKYLLNVADTAIDFLFICYKIPLLLLFFFLLFAVSSNKDKANQQKLNPKMLIASFVVAYSVFQIEDPFSFT